jgi:hypothetical protein
VGARGARLGPHRARAASRRMGDDGEGSVVSALGEREVRAQREGNESGERCGEARRGCLPFIGGWVERACVAHGRRGGCRGGWSG